MFVCYLSDSYQERDKYALEGNFETPTIYMF